jgi:hypothetical protein
MRIRIRDPDLFDPGPGSGMENSGLGSRIRNTAYIGKLFSSFTYT